MIIMFTPVRQDLAKFCHLGTFQWQIHAKRCFVKILFWKIKYDSVGWFWTTLL
jgi:hypothetical protein